MKTFTQENIKPTDSDENKRDLNFEFSFAFEFKQLHETPLSVYADELFDGGMIKTLKVCNDSCPLLPKGKEELKSSKSSSRRKESQITSLSSNVFKLLPNFPANIQQDSKETTDKSSIGSRSWSSSSSSSDWCKKWKLKELLFRSASEGHATRDNNGRKSHETIRFGLTDRSNISPVKYSGSDRRRMEGISAHERHYRKNRAAAEELRRKTFLPYKKTLMGCSDLDPGVYEFCKGHAVEIKYSNADLPNYIN